jgi:hypothetical protein
MAKSHIKTTAAGHAHFGRVSLVGRKGRVDCTILEVGEGDG